MLAGGCLARCTQPWQLGSYINGYASSLTDVSLGEGAVLVKKHRAHAHPGIHLPRSQEREEGREIPLWHPKPQTSGSIWPCGHFPGSMWLCGATLRQFWGQRLSPSGGDWRERKWLNEE